MVSRIFVLFALFLVCKVYAQRSVKKFSSSRKSNASASKSTVSEVVSSRNVPVVQNSDFGLASASNKLFPSQMQSNSFRDIVDLTHNRNRNAGLDRQNNQLQTLLDLNDITAMETSIKDPTVPNLFSHTSDLQRSQGKLNPVLGGENSRSTTKTETKVTKTSTVQRVEPQPIPQRSTNSMPMIIPFNVNGNSDRVPNNPNSPEAVWIETQNSIIDTRKSPALDQNSIKLSPNQEIHRGLPNANTEPENPQSREAELLNNFLQPLIPRGDPPPERITPGSFGLSLRNRNMAQLVSGLATRPQPRRPRQIAMGRESDKPIRGIIVSQSNNNPEQRQANGIITSNLEKKTSQNQKPEKQITSGLGKIKNLFDTNSVQDFGLLSRSVKDGLSTGETESLDGSTAPSWVQTNSQEIGLSQSETGVPITNLRQETRSFTDNPDPTVNNEFNEFPLFPGIPGSATDFGNQNDIGGFEAPNQQIITGVEALNNQNMGSMRNNVNDQSGNVIGDKEIEELINRVVSSVDPNPFPGVPVQPQEQTQNGETGLAGESNSGQLNTPFENGMLMENPFESGSPSQRMVPSAPVLSNNGRPPSQDNTQTQNNANPSVRVSGTNVPNRPRSPSQRGRMGPSNNGLVPRPRQALPNRRPTGFTRPANRGQVRSSTTNNQPVVRNMRNPGNRNFGRINQNRGLNNIVNPRPQISQGPTRMPNNGARPMPLNNFQNSNTRQNLPSNSQGQTTSRLINAINNAFRNNRGPSSNTAQRNNVVQPTNSLPQNRNRFGQEPSNVVEENRLLPNLPTSPIEARRAIRRIQQARTLQEIQQSQQTTQQNEVTDLSGPVGQIASRALNQNNEANLLRPWPPVNQQIRSNSLQENLSRNQNSSSAFRNSNVINRLLQSIDLPKNLPVGQIGSYMILPLGTTNNMTLPRSAGNGRRSPQLSAISSQLASVLNQIVSQNRNVRRLQPNPSNVRVPTRQSATQRRIIPNQQRRTNQWTNRPQARTQAGLNSETLRALQTILGLFQTRLSLTQAQRQRLQTDLQNIVLNRMRPAAGQPSQQRRPVLPTNMVRQIGPQANGQNFRSSNSQAQTRTQSNGLPRTNNQQPTVANNRRRTNVF
ncbi:unnamed protein product [Mytilus edulis]|uniref:Uncharacterized protein n=1 Tax=Mytilus edulis TaxID=6550 RepID=A0A8S3PYY6_MYTED|nr:unnamed protein product [Mytilus edulis]